MEATNMTFDKFSHQNRLRGLDSAYSLVSTIQGYSYIEHLPALYGMWWSGPAEIKGFLATQLRVVDQPASILRTGFQKYWDWLYENIKVKVKEDFQIQRIDRTDELVKMTSQQGDVQEFDFVIVTCNLKDTLSLLDASPLKAEILGGLKERSNLITTLLSCEYSTDPVAISSWTSSLDPKNEARLIPARKFAKVFNPEDVGRREKDYLISYQYVETARENT
jgi:protoporphyrinogen oxidase